MGLLSIFKRKSGDRGSTPPADTNTDPVQEARTRARRRLIGASVLVVIGVIGFPLLFETQPRPIPVDIPIEIPRKDSAPPLVMPAAKPTKPGATAPVEAAPASAPDIVSETQAEAGREVPPPAIKTPSPTAHTATTPAKPAEPVELAPKPAVAAAKPASKPAAGSDDAQRALALREGKPAEKDSAKKEGRFVVQVGAFTENAPAHEMRLKVEKLGLKTYAQVAETSQGHRIRVRVGPFATREEAEKAQGKIKASGAQAVVLTL
ncbi:MAG: SPOR domain-containing protein [Burkholderiales bacterium]|jgi:DedD protein|nr:SPOR domain-containing protein [Burkholderiales bacterium]